MRLQDPIKELEEFLCSLPAWQRKLLEGEQLTVSELEDFASSAGTPQQMFAQEAVREKYENLLQKILSRWQKYVARKKRLVWLQVPKGRPGRPPDHETLERILELKSQGKSYRQIAVSLGAQPDQIPSAIDRYRKLVASARKRSKRGANRD